MCLQADAANIITVASVLVRAKTIVSHVLVDGSVNPDYDI